MSYPNIPDIKPEITITRTDVINILLASIGSEELALGHILNAEGEKIQSVLGTLADQKPAHPNIEDLIRVNESVERTLRNVIKDQMLLQFKLEDVLLIEEKPKPCEKVYCEEQ